MSSNARMIPNFGPVPGKSIVAEPKIYEGLAQLPQEFTVIHSLPYLATVLKRITGRNIAVGEADFLVLHPDLGFLVLEVKGGRIRYEHPYFITGSGKRIDPFKQLDKSVFALPAWLRGAGGPAIQLGYAFAFPDVHMHGQPLPPITIDHTHYPAESVIIDNTDMRAVADRVIAIMRYWKRALRTRSYTRTEIDEIVQLLCPTVDYALPWSERIASDVERWLALTNEQSRELRRLDTQVRTVLTGRSGTGKTLLATAHARNLDRRSEQVLFLLYNAAIAEKVTKQLAGTKVDVSTFHNLCRRACRSLKRPCDETDLWYHSDGPDALSIAIQRNLIRSKAGNEYTALIIDEAQVFADGWLKILVQWFADRPILICCDDSQILPFEKYALPTDIIADVVQASPRLLTVNVRSPRRVYERLEEVLPEKMAQTCSIRDDEADTLEELIAPDPQSALLHVLDELQKDGVKRQEIAVLYVGTEPALPPETRIRFGAYMQVSRYRGMEAPIVIIYVPQISDHYFFDCNTMSCAYGRATTRCIAIYPLEGFVSPNGHMNVVADQPQHTFLPFVKKTIEQQLNQLWPIHKSLQLVEIGRLVGSIHWSEVLGAWFFEKQFMEVADQSIERLLWTRHIIATTNTSVVHAWLGNIQLANLEWWPASTEVTRRIDPTEFALRWCTKCRRWSPHKRLGKNLWEGCVTCDQPIIHVPSEVSGQIHRAVEMLRQPDGYSREEKRELSVFLICLGRWRRLSDEQRSILSHYIDHDLTSSYIVAKLLIGIELFALREGDEAHHDALADRFWRGIPWLHDHLAHKVWYDLIGRGLHGFSQHGWLQATELPGTYIRLPLPTHEVPAEVDAEAG